MNNSRLIYNRSLPWLVQTFIITTTVLIWIGLNDLEVFQAIWFGSLLLYAVAVYVNAILTNRYPDNHVTKIISNRATYCISSVAWGGLPALFVVLGYWAKQYFG